MRLTSFVKVGTRLVDVVDKRGVTHKVRRAVYNYSGYKSGEPQEMKIPKKAWIVKMVAKQKSEKAYH